MSLISHQFQDAAAISQFSERDRAFMQNSAHFADFMAFPNEIDSFVTAANKKAKNFDSTSRELITTVLTEQYNALAISHSLSESNLTALADPTTFAIVTAHQPCLMSGPLYFIYKIASAISMAKRLNDQQTTAKFVPVYVIGSEDHDFEEINHISLFGKKLEWNHKGGGAVGRMKLTGIEEIIDQVESMLGKDKYKDGIVELLRASYQADRTLAEATAHFVYSLFGEHGIIVADLDDVRLKHRAKSVIKSELHDQFSSPLIQANQKRLGDIGFNSQIFSRPINLFYLHDNVRSRIEYENGKFRLGDKELTEKEVDSLLDTKPERFSPNVALRPLYQQLVLPSVVYIGGGAEVAYWMELKGVFDAQKIDFPIILRRDSATWIRSRTLATLNKTGLDINDLWLPMHKAQTAYLAKQEDSNWSLDIRRQAFEGLMNDLTEEVLNIDSGLTKMLKGFGAQQDNFLSKLESKLKKSLKSQHEVAMNRIAKIWEELFPGNSLQERKENFIAIYSVMGPTFVDTLIDCFDPLKPGMHVFSESSESRD